MRNTRSKPMILGHGLGCLLCAAMVSSAQPGPEPPPAPAPPPQSQPAPPPPQQQVLDERLTRYFGGHPPAYDWTRHFRVGLLVGLEIRADFSTKGRFNLPGGNHAPGVYDDGYVLEDQTGNAQGYTSYWGYNSASQYDPATHTLQMHNATGFSATGASRANDAPYYGFDMAYGDSYWEWHGVRIGWEFGFGLLPLNIKDQHSLPAQLTRTVDSFSTAGIVMPTAPYNGGPSGVGPTIVADPTGHSVDSGVPVTFNGARTLDATLYTLRLGPNAHWEISPRWAVSLGGGLALGIASGDLQFRDIFLLPESTVTSAGKIGGTDLVWGGHVSAAVMYHAVENGDFYVGVQFAPMGDARIGAGGRQARLDLSRQVYLSAGINWPF